MQLNKSILLFSIFAVTSVFAKVPSEPLPLKVTPENDVRYYAHCIGGAPTYDLWVQLPKTLTKATLISTLKKKPLLSVPIAIVDHTKEDVAAMGASGTVPDYMSDGFYGFRIDISYNLSKESVILVTSSDNSVTYKLDPVNKWYCVYNP